MAILHVTCDDGAARDAARISLLSDLLASAALERIATLLASIDHN